MIRKEKQIWTDSSVGWFFPFSVNVTIKDTLSLLLLCFLFFIVETLMIKSKGSSVWRYTHPHADLTAVTLPMRIGSTKCRRWDWVLKVKTPQRERRSASKEVKRHYKDNPIRLWKMFLTKSETQWSVTRVLWLIKVFPWKHCSSSTSLFLSLPHMLHLSLHTRNTDMRRGSVATGHTLISAYHHQPTVAAWGSITQHLMGFSPYLATDLSLKPAI